MTGDVANEPTICVLALVGSLRRNSYNRALLRAAIELAPPDLSITSFDRIGELPYYNEDLDPSGVDEAPEAARALRDGLRRTDALLVVTAEYNHGIPGVLKNAIDWASRPVASTPLRGMPVGLMGASPGMVGTARAQQHLRQAFTFTQSHPLAGPEVLVSTAHKKFDAQWRLTDEPTRAFVQQHLLLLRDWTRLLRREPTGHSPHPERNVQ